MPIPHDVHGFEGVLVSEVIAGIDRHHARVVDVLPQ
jgi:hypothetical protein